MRSIKIRLKSKRKLFILGIILMLFIIGGSNSQNSLVSNSNYSNQNISNSYSNTSTNNTKLIPISKNPEASNAIIAPAFNISKSNVSQFDVREDIKSRAPQSTIDIENENLALQIPNGWDFKYQQMNITSIYNTHQLFADQNISSLISTPWQFATNYPSGSSGTIQFSGSTLYGDLRTDTDGDEGTDIIPDGAYAEWVQNIDKPDANLEPYETSFVREGDTQYPIYETFDNDPGWTQDYNNPYGGNTGTATRSLEWNVGYLDAYIKAGTSVVNLGEPSIAWKTNFGWDTSVFSPSKVQLYIEWSVNNLGYEASDNFSVIVRVDDHYLDGRYDAYGTYYANATETTIENDLNGEVEDHGIIGRLFDITNLINGSIATHTLDFGIWLHPDETDDEVDVQFSTVVIIAQEPDQYKIGELGLNLNVAFNSLSDMEGWYLFMYAFSNNYERFTGLDLLTDIFSSASGNKYLEYNLTTQLIDLFNESNFYVGIGILNVYGDRVYENSFTIKFDNLRLDLIYKARDISLVQLTRWTGGTSYESITSEFFTTTGPIDGDNLTLHFEIGNSSYDGSFMDFKSDLFISRLIPNAAEASFYLLNIGLDPNSRVRWIVAYNNTATFDQYRDNSYWNYEPTEYNFTLIDLPAYDGLGGSSLDWNATGVVDPLGNDNPSYVSGHRSAGTANNQYLQNTTIADATNVDPWGGYINGTWKIKYTSPNYLSNASLFIDSAPRLKMYAGNTSEIIINRTQFSYTAPLTGNYNVTFQNGSGSYLTGFPSYNEDITDNYTQPWTVEDKGVGTYRLIAIWNDTNTISRQTTRVGIVTQNIELWRTSAANLLVENSNLQSGDIGSFSLNFSQLTDGAAISGADTAITVYYNETDHLWGRDWAPYLYLVENVVEDSLNPGNYSLDIKTGSVPVGNYSIYIKIALKYYDTKILHSWINITGVALNVKITYGATNSSGYIYMNTENIPYVNDTSSSIIQLNISDGVNDAPLQDAIISGIFNSSEHVFYATDLYSLTQNINDKGFYNLTLETTGLNSTDYSEYNNYTLTISISVPGYASVSFNITTPVHLIPTQLQASNASSLYEGGTFDFFTTFQNVLDPNTPLPLSDGILSWYIINQTTEAVVASGNFSFVLSGVYKATIALSTDSYYVNPGIYKFVVNATQYNCANASWIQKDFEILTKNSTTISLSLTDNIRIGDTMDVLAILTYVDGSPIPNVGVEFTLTYAGTDQFTIVQTTDENGVASYSQIIPYEYANTNLTISAYYAGNETVKAANTTINIDILGKKSVNLTLTYSDEIRVGYSTTLNGTISIEELGLGQYTGIFVTLAAWYDGNDNYPIFIKELHTDENGNISYTIPEIVDEHENITFFMDYAGTPTINYASTSITIDILPKWEISLNLTDIPDTIRIGQTINLNIKAAFQNNSCPEDISGKTIEIIILTGAGEQNSERFLNENGTIVFDYEIPSNAGDFLNLTLIFKETSRINEKILFTHFNVLPKWGLNLELSNLPDIIREGQTLTFIYQAVFTDTDCDESYFGIYTELSIKVGTFTTILNGTLSENGLVNFTYTVPITEAENITLKINTPGTKTISSFTNQTIKSILPQLKTILTIVSQTQLTDFPTNFFISVKLVDETGNPIIGQTIIFIVKDSNGRDIANYSAITNNDGFASISIGIKEVGDYTVIATFPSTGFYASSSTLDFGNDVSIHVVDAGILIMDNIELILIAAGIVTAMAITIRQTVIIPRRNRQRQALMDLHRRFADIENVQYILVIHKITGTSIFSHALTQIPIDETLISGFLSAISAFGKEIGSKVHHGQENKETSPESNVDKSDMKTPSDDSSGLEELAYQQFKIYVKEGEFVRTAVLLLKSPSPTLKEKVGRFTERFEKEYHDILVNYNGQIPRADPIIVLVEETMYADLLYPHNVVVSKVPNYLHKVSKKSTEALILKEADATFQNSFKVREMINQMAAHGRKDVDTFKAINKLRQEKIVFAVNPRTNRLIEQFKPQIERLAPIHRNILLKIEDGITNKQSLMKTLKIKEIIPDLIKLQKMGLITEDNKLTELGELLVMLIRLIPEV